MRLRADSTAGRPGSPSGGLRHSAERPVLKRRSADAGAGLLRCPLQGRLPGSARWICSPEDARADSVHRAKSDPLSGGASRPFPARWLIFGFIVLLASLSSPEALRRVLEALEGGELSAQPSEGSRDDRSPLPT